MLASTTQKIARSDPWDDELEAVNRLPRPLMRDEAQAVVAANPSVSPWQVVAMQAGLGLAVALLAMLVTGQGTVFWSALYGAGVAVLPAALMARGMTSKLSSVSPGISAVSVMLWSTLKIGVSIVMLMLASRLVQPLAWPALLATMALCMLVYWFALLWKRRR